MVTEPQKIAVLGGGISSLAAVFEITSQPNWKEKYDITLYQMGWRLGGKGASGRNPYHAQRIEEHGLHVWFGCYDNAFDLLNRCYEANARPLGQPLSTIAEAFEPAHSFVCMEQVGDRWEKWPIRFPHNQQTPGKIEDPPTIRELMGRMLDLVFEAMVVAHTGNATGNLDMFGEEDRKVLHALSNSFGQRFKSMGKMAGIDLAELDIYEIVATYREFIEQQHARGSYHMLLTILRQTRKWLWQDLKDRMDSTICRRIWLMFDLISANVIGMIEDGVLRSGFSAINKWDYREWVARHSYTPELTADSPVIQAFYSVNFSGYKQATFEAGTALMGAMRIALTYRGAYFYRMQAGMGDVVFGPIYEVLKKRGVKFRFFHRVTSLHANAEGNQLERIRLVRQATLKSGDPDGYDPLVDVRGLPCWPSYPRYEQLVEGDALKAGHIDLESPHSGWQDVEQLELRAGADFDRVILGIPVAALKTIASELIARDQRWADMVTQVTTTATLAAQLWFKPDNLGLGWAFPHLQRAISGTHVLPYETNCDLSNLLSLETWPEGHVPRHLSYLCGALYPHTDLDENDSAYPAQVLEEVRNYTLEYLREHGRDIWPAAYASGEFDWNLLVDPAEGEGEARLNAQYIRANVDPSERYVLSEAGNSEYRMKTDASGYANLLLVGDWIDTGFNAGCIEASVISGKQAARALTGAAIRIPGEVLLPGVGQPRKRAMASRATARAAAKLFQLYQAFSF